jgi:hypothetical protein
VGGLSGVSSISSIGTGLLRDEAVARRLLKGSVRFNSKRWAAIEPPAISHQSHAGSPLLWARHWLTAELGLRSSEFVIAILFFA